MREILFRGQTRKYGEKVRMGDGKKLAGNWVYGGVLQGCGAHSIIYGGGNSDDPSEGLNKWCVHTDTLGQFTGLTDVNGKKIFEGDIIKSDNGKISATSVVKIGEYYPKMFYKMLDMFSPGRKHLLAFGVHAKSIDGGEEMIMFQSPCVTVIGNIHDNPELLGVTDNA